MIRKTRGHRKIGAKVMASALAAAMGFSSLSAGMPGSIAYAETEDDSVITVTDEADAASDSSTASEEEDAATGISAASEEESASDASNESSSDEATEENSKEEVIAEETDDEDKKEDNSENASSQRVFDYDKTDVWDFGAENFGDSYNNRLDVDTINSFFDAEPGTKGVNLASFNLDDGDFVFEDGGYSTTHRLRTSNTDITRYDEKTLKDSDGNVYSGYIYSNKSSTDAVYLAVECKADDVITAYVSSNGKDSDVHFKNMTDESDDTYYTHTLGGAISKMTFYPSQDAQYKFYSATEKLVVARVLREHATYSELSGNVKGFDGTGSFDLVFTNQQNGNEVVATVADGNFSAFLAQGFDYALSLRGADSYVIVSDKTVSIDADSSIDVEIKGVDLVDVKGMIKGVDEEDLASFASNAGFTFTANDPESVYVPELTLTADGEFEVTLQAGVEYTVETEGVDDYTLTTTQVLFEKSVDDAVLTFEKKGTVPVVVKAEGIDSSLLKDAVFKFTLLDKENEYAATKYVYEFTGEQVLGNEAALRNGQYDVLVSGVAGDYCQNVAHTKDAIVDDEHVADGKLTVVIPFESTLKETIAYRELVTVGQGKDCETITEAIEAIRRMERSEDERVTVEIEPGDYQEMVVIDVPNVTLKNAVSGGSIVTKDAGVGIASDSVRITGYYGHGYVYYSMGSDCKYDAELLEVNKYNGYPSYINPGSGTTDGSFWNATVVVKASGFEAKDIIFENSFNQYQSELAAEDVIVAATGAKEKAGAPRSEMSAKDVTVQEKAYVERAAALALTSAAKEAYFDNCAFIGRQDTLYGQAGATAAFYGSDVYGGTDYIFGGMTAVFAKCNLIFNTSDSDKNDVGYITAAQQTSASTRGFLMYNCTVKSTTPGVNTASTYESKPGYFGRPWAPTTSEVVFYDTVIDKTCEQYKSISESLIQPVGWLNTLSGTTIRNVEYGTYEVAEVDNSANRADWSPVSTVAETTDGKAITVASFLGDFDPFKANAKDMTISFPDGTIEDEPSSGEEETQETTVYSFESADVAAFDAGAKADGDAEKVGTDNYFTLLYSSKSKVDSSTKTWEDGYTSGVRVNFGGAASTSKNAVKFTTSNDNAVLKIWWASNGRQMIVLDKDGEKFAVTETEAVKNSPYISTIELGAAGTYYLGGDGGTNYLFKVEVTDGEIKEVERPEWNKVAAPKITSAAVNEKDSSKIDVNVNATVGTLGGDRLVVRMYDAQDTEIAALSSIQETNDFTFSFTPAKSGEYHFVAELTREDEKEPKTGKSGSVQFILPLAKSQIKSVVNKGNGNVQVKFYSVPEATSYTLYATDLSDKEAAMVKAVYTPEQAVDNNTTEYAYTFVGLTKGNDYEISVYANRGNDISDKSAVNVTVTEESEKEWVFAAFGQGVSSKESECGSSVNDDGSVTVWSLKNKGKIVPATTDGLSFYYTDVPADMNFTLTATATIDTWSFTNGQEGFGLMACDRVGVNGNSAVFWNNSYMASGTKVEYFYDDEKQEATLDETGSKITMKLGLGAQEKTGVTTDNISLLAANDTETINNEFSSKMYTLETSCAANGSGTYNLFDKEAAGTAKGTVENPLTSVRLRIQKNNTGFFVSYLDENDNVLGMKKFYDTTALSKLDSEKIYVGFFASRTFKATFSDIDLTVIDPADDEPAEEKPVSYVAPNYKAISSTYSNTEKYEIQYTGNADGVLTVQDEAGKAVIDAQHVLANAVAKATVKLNRGDNRFTFTFTPDADFLPEGDVSKRLSSYETAEFDLVVKYATVNDNDKIYVTPDGKADAEGTESDPTDIYTAVKYVQPGQTIVLAAGTYSLRSTVKVERGIDGTPSKPIRMVTTGGRAVFDFNSACAGFVFAGNYWYVNGIDCTKSGNSLKGIQVSGSHITLEDIHTYENGNTGIQVSRYLTSDDRSEWPSYDLILNCTSYSNADAGYEDADGFAAKLTCGEGIVFDGCISYNNADDGWDLFAKAESGTIGQVTIQNSVAFANGYSVDGKSLGNGNGFKMGGSSMSGPHKLINSIAWGNKAKGIDSNSGPDIQVYNSMSFNNGSNNVALYTNDTANTNFYVDGVLSYRTEGTGTNENLKLKGTQDTSKVYGKLNFFWTDGECANADGLKVTDDWFVSLAAPYANASDPIAVANGMRNENGSIDLGDFMKLTDNAVKTLANAGIESGDVVAALTGNYEAVTDERDIDGSSEDAANDAEEEPTEEIKGEFVTKWGATYFVTENGDKLTGLNEIAGDLYNFSERGVMSVSTTVTIGDATYYFGSDGKAVRSDFLTKWGTTYYYNENAVQVKDSMVVIDNNTYYFNAKGAMVKSAFVDFEDGTRYFDKNGVMVVSDTITRWFKKYTFDENGLLMN